MDEDNETTKIVKNLNVLSLEKDKETPVNINKIGRRRRKKMRVSDFSQLYSRKLQCLFTPKKGKYEKILYVGFYYVLNEPFQLSHVRYYWGIRKKISVKDLFVEINNIGWNRFLFVLKLLLKVKRIEIDCIKKYISDDYFPTKILASSGFL